MSLRDEINRVAKTSTEYEKEQLQKKMDEKTASITQNGKSLFEKLRIQLKLDASRGKIHRGKLTGVLQFSSSWSLDTPPELRGKGYILKPNIEKDFVHRGLGIFTNEYVWKITVSATDEIVGAYEHLKKLASEEGISIGELFIIDSDGITYSKSRITVTDKHDRKNYDFAVNYSMMV